MKYTNEVIKNKLFFTITEGQFKGIKYSYESLTSAAGLKYNIIEGKKVINDNNKLLFENEIQNILSDKLKKIKK